MKTHIILPDAIREVMDQFKKSGYEIYVVGGSVRDQLLGKNTTNWDMTTNATPEKIQSLFTRSIYNNTYGTVIVPYEKGTIQYLLEITPFRKEDNYDDNRHPETVEWAQTLVEDVQRRDFTINAIAYDGENIIDHVGGLKDLEKKIVRAVGNPDKRFQEDALRLLRAIRFSCQLGFVIEANTYRAVKKDAKLLENISWERISDEFLKIIASERPRVGIEYLRDTGMLSHILPELEACFEIDQKSPFRHHTDDVGTHSIKSLEACRSTDPITRLATLLHDIGKVDTVERDEKIGLVTFHNHEHVGAGHAAKIADRLRLSRKQKEKLVTLVRYHMFSVNEHQTDKALRRFIKNVTPEYLDDILELRTADRLGSGVPETSWRTDLFKRKLIEVQKQPFSIKDLKIDGKDIMKTLNLKPGPRIGEILANLFERVEDGKIANNKATLLKEIKSL